MGRLLLDVSTRHYIAGKASHGELLSFVCFVPNPAPSLHKQSANFNETTESKVSRTGPTAQSTAVKTRNHNKNPGNIPSNFYYSPLGPCERLLLRAATIEEISLSYKLHKANTYSNKLTYRAYVNIY